MRYALPAGLLALGVLWYLSRRETPRQEPSGEGGVSPHRTGRDFGLTDNKGWTRARLAQLVETLHAHRWPADEAKREAVARALLSQWGIETGFGKSEYNYNLGGWKAGKGKTAVLLRNGTTGKLERWEAWPTVHASMADHVARLRQRWPKAAELLEADPSSTAWVEALGRGGYYEEPPAEYAKSVARARQTVDKLAPPGAEHPATPDGWIP